MAGLTGGYSRACEDVALIIPTYWMIWSGRAGDPTSARGMAVAQDSWEGRVMTSARGSELASSIEQAIDKGTTSVEKIHKSIVDLPLRVLEESGLLTGPAKEVRRVQNHVIAAVYDTIRDINHQVGTLAAKALLKAAGRRGMPAEASARHHAAMR
jgi:hypothetical protein